MARSNYGWTPERRAAAAERMRQLWATGYRPPRYRPQRNAWTEGEDQTIRRLAGTVTVAEVVVAVNERSRVRRSTNAVEIRARHLGVSIQAPGLTAMRVAFLFSCSQPTVLGWLERGLLGGQRISGARNSQWIIRDEDIARFIRNHPVIYDWRLIRNRRWRGEGEVAWRVSGYMTIDEAAAVIGVSRADFRDYYIRTGLINAPRCHLPSRFWQFFVKRGDLMNLMERAS